MMAEEEQEQDVLQTLWKVKKDLPIKDRKRNFKTYKDCFLGREFVDILVEKKEVLSRKEGVEFGTLVLSKGLIRHVNDKPVFKDYETFYRFVEESSPEAEESTKLKHRVCVLGSEKCGKTALCLKFSKDSFSAEYEQTVTENYLRRENFGTDNVTVEMLDCGSINGEELEAKLAKWNEWATGYMLVYSITSKASVESIPKLFTTLIKTRQFKVTPVVLVGTKLDLLEDRKVSREEAQTFATRYRCPHIETSAVTGDGIMEAFQTEVNEIKKVAFITGPVQHMKGWMKMKRKGKQYNRYYLLMTDSGLRYYSDEPKGDSPLSDITNLKGVIPMQNCQVDIVSLPDEGRRYTDSDAKGGKKKSERRSSDPAVSGGKSPKVEKRKKKDTPPSSPIGSPASDSPSPTGSPSQRKPKDKEDPASIARKNSFQGLKKEQLKIYIVDNNENVYELLASSPKERDDWYKHLYRCAEKASSSARKYPMLESSQSETDDDAAQEGKDYSTMTEEEIIQEGIIAFNKKPKKGIEILLKGNVVKDTPDDIGKFLFSRKGLKKKTVGQYLGGNEPFNIEVLKVYLKQIDFTGTPFDDALRNFLANFTLPSEAQQIDRIMENFATRFCECNPTVFENPDVGYILAFSLIMLNTDSHNNAIPPERKMTKEQFVSNNRGINNGKDLAREYLEELFDKIRAKAFAMEHERDEFNQWDKQGWLNVKEAKARDSTLNSKKKGPAGRRLWCIISTCCLYIFENPLDKKPFHIIPLDNLEIDSVLEAGDQTEESNGFILYNPNPDVGIKSALDGKEVFLRELHFICETRKSKMEWMLTFKLSLVSAPDYRKK